MRVASKIGLGAGLLVALMVLSLGYEVHLVRRLQRINTKLAHSSVEVSQSSVRMERLLRSLEYSVQQYLAFERIEGGDADADALEVLQTAETVKAAADAEVRGMALITKSDLEKEAFALLLEAWDRYVSLSGFDPDALATFTDEQTDELRQRLRESVGSLRERLTDLEEANRTQREVLIGRADKASRQAMTASWAVVAAAAVISLFVLALTMRSINEPLNRLVEGTRAVSEGRFFYQIDLPGNDEFSVMATSFNEMVHRLGAIDQMKREFLSHVSHELRTPLVAMQETSGLLLEELPGPLNEKQRRLISLSLNGSKRLSAMISKLLDLSRIEAGALEYDLKRHDLVEVANTAAGEFEARARDHALLLRVLLPESSLFARCDRDRIIQVVENLLENAIKFSPPDETIEIEVKRTKRRDIPAGLLGKAGLKALGERPTRLTVSDAGPGVPIESRERIFEKFRQLQRGKSSETGVGLGLAICREIVQAHGGAIWVDDSKKGGSSFHVVLPSDRSLPRKKQHVDRAQKQPTAQA